MMANTEAQMAAVDQDFIGSDAEPEVQGNEASAALDARLVGLTPRTARLVRDARRALETRHYAEAEPLLRRAQTSAGEHAEYLRLLGVLHQAQKRPAEAITVLRRALERAPGDALILTNLGTALRANDELDVAIVTLRRACDLAPELPAAWYNLGRALSADARPGEAHDAYARALKCDPGHTKARIGYADTLRTFGHAEEAASEYLLALDQPDSMQAWARLANMKTRRFRAEETDRLERLFAAPGLSDEHRTLLGFALVKALEDQNRYPEAFTVLTMANAIKRRSVQWDAAAFSRRADAIMHTLQHPPKSASAATMGHEVIFVVSLPRSGSTLVEQILASHPDIEGANELPDLGNVLEAESKRTGREFPDWVPQATPQDWRRLGSEYLDRTARWRKERPRFTDKALSNWRVIGAARAMLPGARFVDARRDATETCLSCYRQLFGRGHAYAYDLGELAMYWHDYDRMMRFWHARHPQAIREQVHERLQADFENEVRSLLDFCGLPFDDACLRFHETERNVRTISATQVREPLRRNTMRSHHYGNLLLPLRLALGTAG